MTKISGDVAQQGTTAGAAVLDAIDANRVSNFPALRTDSNQGTTNGSGTRGRASLVARSDQAPLKMQTADPAITRSGNAETFTMRDLAASKYKLGSRFDKLVDSSPSLRGALVDMQKRGFRIVLGQATATNMAEKTVTIARAEFLRLDHLAGSLAHELGHVTDQSRYLDFRDRNSYVKSCLDSEGVAVLFNLKVRQELIDAKQGEIGVLGQPAFSKQAVQDWNSAAAGRIDLEQLREKLAVGYATQNPQVAASQTYAEFCGAQFDSLTRYNPEYLGKVYRGAESDGI